jgi:hypothetical protein
MRNLRPLILLLLLAAPLANAMNAIFWQPQLRDNSVTQTQWLSLMQSVRQQGFDTLVLQWTQYGSAFADEKESQQLQQRAADARKAGLRVIVGLNADPDFFSRQKQTGAAREHYLQRLRVADLHQLKRWNAAFQPDGWYLSAEIDDLNWRNPEARAQLIQWLKETRSQIAVHSSQPLYISSFFAGNMTPDGYRQLLTDIRQTGIKVWVQDGYGVRSLTPAARQQYLEGSTRCDGPASGTVYEIFKSIPGETFKAQPLSAAEMKTQLAQKSECGKDRIFFSLRYLPEANGVLQWQ